VDKIKKYYETERVSNSTLSRVANPRLFKRLKPETYDSPALRVGSALDCLLTDPTRWEDEFAVMTVDRPFGKIGDFTNNLPDGITKRSPMSAYESAYEEAGYMRSIDWVVDNFWKTPEAVEFYETKYKAVGKKILSASEFEGVQRAKLSILENDFTNLYFHTLFIEHELMHQVPIYFEYEGVKCKALLDGILIDHNKKTIEPFDLKTTGKNVYDFSDSFLQFGYFRQCAFYEYALKTKQSPVKDLLKSGYELKDFIFIVVESSKDSINPAVIFPTTPNDRRSGFMGGYAKGKYYKGINRLLEEYLFYTQNDLWDLPKDLLESDGRMPLDVFTN